MKNKRYRSHTCILATKDTKGKLIFASERRITMDLDRLQIAPRSKIIKKNGLLLAGAGDGYICELIIDIFNPKEYLQLNSKIDPIIYIHEIFFQKAVAFLRHHGVIDKEDLKVIEHKGHSHDDNGIEASFLIGIKGKLFTFVVSSSGIYIESAPLPDAIGIGAEYALGAYKALEGSKLSSVNRVKKAIQIAAHFSPGCDDNIDIIRED